VRVRETMASSTLLSADAIARSAAFLADADQAIDWAAEQEWSQVTIEGEAFIYRPIAPPEVRRRIVVKILAAIRTEGTEEPRGREIAKLLESLEAGAVATLQGVRCQGGAAWRFAPAPERRNR
jgi:tRNA(Ile)-lysidine synthase